MPGKFRIDIWDEKTSRYIPATVIYDHIGPLTIKPADAAHPASEYHSASDAFDDIEAIYKPPCVVVGDVQTGKYWFQREDCDIE